MAFRDLVLVFMINLMWGLNFIAVKWAVVDFPPLVANTVRFMIVLLVLLPWLRLVRGRMKDMCIIAFVMGVLHFGAIFMGMSRADEVGAIAIAAQLSVPFSTLMAILFLKESIGWKRVSGIALSFAGVMVLGFDPKVFSYLDALGWIVFSSIVYGVSTILMRRLKDVRAATTQAWVALAGIIGSASLSYVFESGQIESLSNAQSLAWMGVVYSAIGSSIIGHGGVNYLLQKYEVTAVSPYLLMTPFFAVAGGVLILDETLTWRVVLGGLLTITGVLIVTLRNKARVQSGDENATSDHQHGDNQQKTLAS